MQASSNPFILKMGSLSLLSICLKSVQANKTETWSKCFAEQRTVLKSKELLNVVLVKSRTALWQTITSNAGSNHRMAGNIPCTMPLPRTLSWALKSQSYGDMAPQMAHHFHSSSHWSSSLSSTAAQKQQRCPGHLPAQAHGHCCYQNVPRHSRVR